MMQAQPQAPHHPHSRPLGPRRLPQPPTNRAPPPQAVPDPDETKPLVINKPRPQPSPSLSPPSSSSSTITLGVPKLPSRSRPTTPKISLQIPMQSNHGPDSYYGGGPKPEQTQASASTEDEGVTIMPGSGLTAHPTVKPSDPVGQVREMIETMRLDPQDDDAVLDPAFTTSWSNDLLEEVSRLGEGASGAVHKVKEKRNGTIMARKTITTRAAPIKQLVRELSIMAKTKHVNIVKFYGAFMSSSSSEVMILMEYCEGGSLEAIGKRIKEIGAVVGEKIAGRITEGVLSGLAYLHAHKTIHRDIKPSNILLSREGVVKLCDFGVSGELVGSFVGTFTGTGLYMAPERISGNDYTIRSDVWSLGITLLELVQNRFPFPSDLPAIELMMYITSGEPPRLEDESGVRWSDPMKDFVRQALITDASTRPPPRDMLVHPWIVEVMQQEVHMARWIRQVWDWKRPRRTKDDSSTSRPNTANSSRPQSSHRSTGSTGDSPEESPP
ncbi:Protein kinase C signaling pathway involved MAPKK protein [Marasmius sp. AFHP31]|nr:Protein kinase C signaling pathway involved MAPKK protein [Marasmius sp. AFHP31]